MEPLGKLDGTIYGITSQGGTAAAAAKEGWGIKYPVRTDSRLEIAAALRARGLPVPCVNTNTLGYLAGMATPGGEYESGMYQPTVLVLTRDFECLFSWVAVPGPSNLGGACPVRPSANRVLRAAKGQPVAGSRGSRPWQQPRLVGYFGPLLVLLLLANGNFVRPRTLTLDGSGRQRLGNKLAPLKLGAAFLLVGFAWRRNPQAVAAGLAAYAGAVFWRWGAFFRRAVRLPEARPEECSGGKGAPPRSEGKDAG